MLADDDDDQEFLEDDFDDDEDRDGWEFDWEVGDDDRKQTI